MSVTSVVEFNNIGEKATFFDDKSVEVTCGPTILRFVKTDGPPVDSCEEETALVERAAVITVPHMADWARENGIDLETMEPDVENTKSLEKYMLKVRPVAMAKILEEADNCMTLAGTSVVWWLIDDYSTYIEEKYSHHPKLSAEPGAKR